MKNLISANWFIYDLKIFVHSPMLLCYKIVLGDIRNVYKAEGSYTLIVCCLQSIALQSSMGRGLMTKHSTDSFKPNNGL